MKTKTTAVNMGVLTINVMSNPLNLISGKKYRVIKLFADYDHLEHKVGEQWTFIETHFIPYDDGLTLHVVHDTMPNQMVYRLQWRQEEQAEIIEHFTGYFESC